ncbi:MULTISPECIES: hypothetical protein [Sorangium]|uniref:hypothetical protein n=1 Tax=Sorangium TaxID=39643 RepID=UPI003D9C5E88
MALSWLFMYALPLLTVLAVGLLGTTRRIGFWGALLVAVLLTPVGGFIVTLISGPKRLRVVRPKRLQVVTTWKGKRAD